MLSYLLIKSHTTHYFRDNPDQHSNHLINQPTGAILRPCTSFTGVGHRQRIRIILHNIIYYNRCLICSICQIIFHCIKYLIFNQPPPFLSKSHPTLPQTQSDLILIFLKHKHLNHYYLALPIMTNLLFLERSRRAFM